MLTPAPPPRGGTRNVYDSDQLDPVHSLTATGFLMCRYLVVRSDDQFTSTVPTPVVTSFLATIPTLQQDSPTVYYGLDGTVQVLLLRCDHAGNYTHDRDWPPPDKVNRVELICSCFGPQRDHEWEALAGQVADLLAWEVVDDETDEVLRPRPSTAAS